MTTPQRLSAGAPRAALDGLWLTHVVPVAVLAAGGFSLGLGLGSTPELRASGDRALDSDGDGLADIVEQIRWMDAFSADTDGDGFSDVEELARQSDPLLGDSVPDTSITRASVGLAAYTERGNLHGVIAIHARGDSLSASEFHYGIGIDGVPIELPPSVYLYDADIQVLPASDPDDVLILVDSKVHEGVVEALGGQVSTYATIFPPAGKQTTSTTAASSDGITYYTEDSESVSPAIADVVHILSVSGQLLELADAPYFYQNMLEGSAAAVGTTTINTPGMTTGVSTGTTTGTGPSTSGGGTGVYRPLGGADDLPSSFEPGEVCLQTTSQVGQAGGLVVYLVETANCVEAELTSFCSPGCENLSGDLVEILDPLSLIGG